MMIHCIFLIVKNMNMKAPICVSFMGCDKVLLLKHEEKMNEINAFNKAVKLGAIIEYPSTFETMFNPFPPRRSPLTSKTVWC